ncbi:MAG: hypothetical protein CMF42_03640 [Legionellales bacterium]|nr:hypothetical protein [Legionellales bacterium]|tara:strand:+ start:1884 stop:2318 length:435 start_codon:yes stop_codon:yes gene_type:complete
MLRYLLILILSTSFGAMSMVETQFYDNYVNSESVIKTKSGLLYKILRKGDGDVSPTVTQVVTVNYEGKLTDGKIFDSSYERGVPAKFGVNQVIPGWVEGLQLMHVGDEFEFVIPPELAYGANGVPGVIPPNSILIFKVSLISIS